MRYQLDLVSRYEQVCAEAHIAPFPPTYDTVSLLVSHLVVDREGSSKTLRAAVTAVKIVAGERGYEWLDAPAIFKLGRLVKQMEYEDPFAVERKKGLQVKDLIRWLESCDLEDVFQLQEATILFLGHDALLRSGELLGGLRVKDIVWTEGGIGVWLARSKANRAGDGELVTVPYYSETCAVSLMRRWF